MHNTISLGSPAINTPSYAYKRWLRMAIDRLQIPAKVFYMELDVSQPTWSRWTDYASKQELPGHLLPLVMDLLDEQAAQDFLKLRNEKASSRLAS